ncbi:hypothetical protein SPRG_10774 [Saprolegnia parasitica CBS 223.65]|uniref:Uncharacterized protein n=1 Tax=Saprolegnia parasitica (strain CBS 223.65) TaxID=695850 RepID=A0A067BYH8_SAPPC|nr:hypothetical protein SPRG_10774 [Saprolegnia parasitica CBS 223.65]KDO23579.1 hypothetical protein SPRG_10774 [Saprolegnia parasitica CBS 223.65]|eukprot:XP_012205727.1 hypothetical protein SPRG_10774 [Saprolegnia parasitica CBS 223.65]
MPAKPVDAGRPQEIDYVSKQANLTAQIESEQMAAKRWWDDFGLCYIDNSKAEDFTYENRIKKLQEKLQDEKMQKAKMTTTSAAYGTGKPFKECTTKKALLLKNPTKK